jgi:4-oxalocrotonate tautomerase
VPPHVVVKRSPGESEMQKTRLANDIARDVMQVLGYGEESVSGAFEEIPATEWGRQRVPAGHRPEHSQAIQETRLPATRCSGGQPEE